MLTNCHALKPSYLLDVMPWPSHLTLFFDVPLILLFIYGILICPSLGMASFLQKERVWGH